MKNIKNIIFKGAKTFFQFGWLIPLYLSIYNIIIWSECEVEVRVIKELYKTEVKPCKSIFYTSLEFSDITIQLSCTWLAIVIIYWIMTRGKKILFLENEDKKTRTGRAALSIFSKSPTSDKEIQA